MEEKILSLAKYLTKKTLKKYSSTAEEEASYLYGLQVILFNIISAISPLAISLLFGKICNTFIVMLSFGALRIISGGIHLNSCTKCYLCTNAIILLGGIVTPNIFRFNFKPKLIIFLFLILFHLRYSPVDSSSKTFETHMYKWITIMLIIVYFALTIKFPSISALLIYSSIMQMLTALPLIISSE